MFKILFKISRMQQLKYKSPPPSSSSFFLGCPGAVAPALPLDPHQRPSGETETAVPTVNFNPSPQGVGTLTSSHQGGRL